MATTLGNGTITFGDGTTLSSGSMINSIQRGTSTGGTITISNVNTSKIMVLLDGISLGNQNGIYALPYLSTVNSSTSITIDASGYPTGQTQTFSWQVIEFK